jgi:small subunit ribosomal protein S18
MPGSTHSGRGEGGGGRYEDRGGRGEGGGGGRYEDRGGRGGGGGDDRGGRRPRRFHRGKVCQFCVDKSIYIDYKDLERLRGYVTDSGKILPRRITGNCASHQRMTTTALKRARMVALLPYKAR